MTDYAAIKRAVKRENAIEREKRHEAARLKLSRARHRRRAQRRCFWTSPLGHVWKQVSKYRDRCVACGKHRQRPSSAS